MGVATCGDKCAEEELAIVNDRAESTGDQCGKCLREYVLFGLPDAVGTHTCLLLALDYLLATRPVFGFHPKEAAIAKQVLIIGDHDAVGAATEAELAAAGCEVSRIMGDSRRVQELLQMRLEESAATHTVSPVG